MLTIIIPTKNRAIFLEKLIPLLLGDNCPADKILIGKDEGTIDNTQEILDKFQANKKLHVYTTPSKTGPLGANNFLFDCVDTKYFMQLSDDDYFDPLLIGKLVKLMEKTDAALGFGKYCIEDGEELKQIVHPGWANRCRYESDFLALLAHDSYMFPGATVFKTSIIRENGPHHRNSFFDSNLNDLVPLDGLGGFRALDWDLMLNISYRFPSRVVFMDEYIATFRKTDGQLTSDENYHQTGRAAFEMAILILKYFAAHSARDLIYSNNLVIDQILSLLTYKFSQIGNKTPAIETGYVPHINAAYSLLSSLKNTRS